MREINPTRVLEAKDVDNRGLIDQVIRATRMAVPRVGTWPVDTRDRAPEMVHAWIRQRIAYVPRGAEGRITKMPVKSLRDGRGDCKSYAVVAAALLRRAGYPVQLRFIQQTRPGFTHVYAVANGIPVDPLLAFGAEAPYTRKMDLNF